MTQNEITLRQPGPPKFERLHHMAAPEPGTYWKAVETIASTSNGRIDINRVEKGEALLLIDIVMADGAPHTYVLAAHPRHGKNASPERVHADDFHDLFEPAADGEALRAAEIQELQAAMVETQRAILAPPPQTANPARAQLAHDPEASDGTALVTRDQIAAMTQYATQIQHQAKAQAAWIEKQTTKLSEQTSTLACFYSEAAQVQLARAKAALSGVEGILKTVENLRLYTGDDVELIILREGEPAGAGEPLTIYQECLAFDEETAILVERGGLDHTQVDHLAEALSDPALVVRMIPAPRGIALVRFRNTYKEFVKGEDIASAMYNREMNRVSRVNRLLLRDGENLYLISAGEAFEGLKQLLTSAGEQSAYFADGEVKHEHLGYARARATQLSNLEKNAKALIVLWGLRDRDEVLKTWNAPRGASWLDPAFQNDWMKLISSDALIGVKRPSYGEWREAQNASIAPGSWVALNGSAVATPANVKVASQVSIAQVYTEKGAMKIKVPVVARYSWQDTPRMKQCVVEITTKIIRDGEILCLDRASADDLRYYLTSRVQRRSYSHYITLFREAAKWVESRDEAEAPFREYVTKAAADGGIVAEAETMSRAITEAIAAARLSMRGAKIPDRSAPAFKVFVKTALDILYVKLRGADAVAQAAKAHFGEGLAKVVMDRDGYKAYVKPSKPDIDRRLPVSGVYAALRFRVTETGIEVTSSGEITSLAAKRGEEIVKQWPEASVEWKYRSNPEDYLKAFDQIHMASERAAALLTPEFAEDLIKRQNRQLIHNRSKYVTRMVVGVPIGTITWPDDDQRGPAVLFAVADALRLASDLGGAGMHQKVREFISKWYGKPQAQLDRFEDQCTKSPWSLEGFWVKNLPAELEPISYWETSKDSGFTVNLSDQKRSRFVVSSSSALGVKLVPELLDVLQAPTRPPR